MDKTFLLRLGVTILQVALDGIVVVSIVRGNCTVTGTFKEIACRVGVIRKMSRSYVDVSCRNDGPRKRRTSFRLNESLFDEELEV
jgi:hypothetical protein